MRIEYQGVVESQPTYQHVGYIAAAVTTEYIDYRAQGLSTLSLSMAAVLLALGLMVARRSRAVWTWALAGLLVVGAVSVGVAAMVGSGRRVPDVSVEFYRTLHNLEAICAETDAWRQEMGRLPTEAEWRERMRTSPHCRDGWDYPFKYERLTERFGQDGQWYRVMSTPERMPEGFFTDPEDKSITSMWIIASDDLGGDGVFGTQDDRGVVGLVLDQVRANPKRYSHGRKPRY